MEERFYVKNKNIFILAIIACFLWGSAFPSIKIGYELFRVGEEDVYSKLVFAGYRFLFAGIIVLVYKIIKTKSGFRLSKRNILSLILLGILQTSLQYTFFYIGLAYTTGVSGSVINGTGTFFSIILAHFIYKDDKITKNKIIGCILGFLGVLLVSFQDGSDAINYKIIIGDICVLISTIMASIANIYSKKLVQTIDSYVVTGFQLSIGGAMLLITGYVLGGELSVYSTSSVILLIYLALISSVAYLLWAQLLKYNKVSKIEFFKFLIPVFGTILSGIILNEDIFRLNTLLALILVSLGIALSNTKNNFLQI